MAVNATDSALHTAAFGMLGGLVSAVTSHPLDTLKTRLQTGAGVGGIQGVRGLFRGLAAPCLSVPPAWAANFLTYGLALRVTGDETTLQHASAGAISGVVWGLCVSPFELVKCVAQNDGKSSRQVWAGILRRTSSSSSSTTTTTTTTTTSRSLNGVLSRLSRGLELAMLRDFIGIGIWFGAYHYASHTLETSAFVAGGFAGCTCWLAIFPVDSWKTMHQTTRMTLSQSFLATRALMGGTKSNTLCLLPVLMARQFVAMGSSMMFVDFVKTRVGKSFD
jgi:solute carrier family 25 carnitine/acylcarnitine transporter 20/29